MYYVIQNDQLIGVKGFWIYVCETLYSFVGTAEKISPYLSKATLVKSVHVTHFYKLPLQYKELGLKIITIFEYFIASFDYLAVYFFINDSVVIVSL
jgi:hypothetical protein